MNGLTTLPDRLTACPRCDGSIDDSHLPERLLCRDCDDWFRVVGDLDQRLDRHDFSDIIEHTRSHPEDCLCEACWFARRDAPGYI